MNFDIILRPNHKINVFFDFIIWVFFLQKFSYACNSKNIKSLGQKKKNVDKRETLAFF